MNRRVVLIGGAVIALGLVYLILRKVTGAANVAVDSVSKGIADAIVDIDHDEVQVLGNVVMPNGQRIPLQQVALKPDFTFAYNGVRYRVTKRRPDNDYDAVKA